MSWLRKRAKPGVLVVIGFASAPSGQKVPLLAFPDEATEEQIEFAEEWLRLASAPDSEWEREE